MTTTNLDDFIINGKNGTYLAPYSSFGCYPLFYFNATTYSCLCSKCAYEDYTDEDEEYEWAVDANWEDSHMYCDGCSERIESAYADDILDKE